VVPVETLQKLSIFKGTSSASLERLAKDVVSKIYAKGEVICREGETSTGIFLIYSGSVSVQKQLSESGGPSKVVARLEAEEFFGEMAFLDQAPYSASVVAQDKTEIYMLPRQSLGELIKKDAAAALDQVITLMGGLSSRLRRTTQESVTVYEVARILGQGLAVEEMMNRILPVLGTGLGQEATVAFYRWNPFNEEYALIQTQGPARELFVPVIDQTAEILKESSPALSIPDLSRARLVGLLGLATGHLLLSRVTMQENPEGLLFCYNREPNSFDNGDKQLIETTAAVLAPALTTARAREEEEARLHLEKSKQRFVF